MNKIAVRDLHKSYSGKEVIRGVDFDIPEGTIFGLLGPNGAGKTTIIEIILGLRTRDAGEISVSGVDPAKNPGKIRSIAGAQLQNTVINDKTKVWEALDLFASFYPKPVSPALLMKQVGLEEKKDSYFQTLSGGEKQRLGIALALIGNPEIIFLDEPTANLDAAIRRSLHGLIQEIKELKKTIVLTTHYIEEAEKLCDEVAILQNGKILRKGTPAWLRRTAEINHCIHLRFSQNVEPEDLQRLQGVEKVSWENGEYVISGHNAEEMLAEIRKYAEHAACSITSSAVVLPTLEDVYVELTTAAGGSGS
jgi:ABC-2 type transport system ATP-binding protein